MYQYSSQFVTNIKDIHGKTGKKWLKELPNLIKQLEASWDIKLVSPVSNLTYSFVTTVELKTNSLGILKIIPPSDRSDAEIEWYRLQTQSTPRLYNADQKRGALLIENLTPGKSVKHFVIEGRDNEATGIICDVIKNFDTLRIKDNPHFKHVSDLKNSLKILDGKIDKTLLDKAKNLLKDLTKDRSRDVLLHGDLHHDNILSSGSTWKAIDPHGYIGPKSFEVGAMLRNPYDYFPTDASLEKIIARRREILCKKLPFETWEIDGWLYVYTLIATGWSVENHDEIPSAHIEIIKVLHRYA